MGEPTCFDITWRGGAYRVSIPNYGGGTVYTAEHVARLTRENEALRKAIENVRMTVIGKNVYFGVVAEDGCWSVVIPPEGLSIFEQWFAESRAALSLKDSAS